MSRPKKEYKALNCKLDKKIWDELDEYSKETGVNKTFVVEKAVGEYLDKKEKTREIPKVLKKNKEF